MGLLGPYWLGARIGSHHWTKWPLTQLCVVMLLGLDIALQCAV